MDSSSSLPPHNLPTPPTPLIGRQPEIRAACKEMLRPNVRLLTLTGPPGIGKTRLALAVASELRPEFLHGVFFVDLAPVSDPTLLSLTIVQTLGLVHAGQGTALETLQSYLKDKQVLLLLDNFEQVLSAGSEVASLLASCPGLKALATSREALHLRWEHVLPVPPLRLPDPHRQHGLRALANTPAIALFVRRARAVNPTFALAQENANDVAEVCARLEGIPLAIELAAAQTDIMGPQEILAGLKQSGYALLSRGARDLPARHRTLWSGLDWSYDLLAPEERQLFLRLSVFVGGSTPEAVEGVCGSEGELPGLLSGGIAALVRKSLLRITLTNDGEKRLRMLEATRAYAWTRLHEGEEAETIQRRHSAYFLRLAERALQQMSSPHQQLWLGRIESDFDNLRAALHWFREHDEGEQGLRLAGALWQFWWQRGYFSEGLAWLEGFLKSTAALGPGKAHAVALTGAGQLLSYSGDQRTARARHEEALAIFRELGDKSGTAYALRNLAGAVLFEGQFALASRLLEESLALFRELDDQWGEGMALNVLGETTLFAGEYALARLYSEQSLAIRRQLGDEFGIAASLNNLANVALLSRDFATARPLYEESLHGWVKLGNRWRIAVTLDGMTLLAAGQGQPARAVRLAGAAHVLHRTISAPLPAPALGWFDEALRRARQALGEEDFAAAWEAGHSMSIEQAVDLALDRGERPSQSAMPPRAAPALTKREREVAKLIARGLTNRGIAVELVISSRTVETHVENIRNKLGMSSRAQVAAWAAGQGLLSK